MFIGRRAIFSGRSAQPGRGVFTPRRTVIVPPPVDILGGDGAFDDADNWTLVSGSTISGGAFNSDGSNGNGANTHAATVTLGVTYKVKFTTARVSGTMRVRFAAGTGALTLGTARLASGTFEENLTALGDGAVTIQVLNYDGTVDNLTVTVA